MWGRSSKAEASRFPVRTRARHRHRFIRTKICYPDLGQPKRFPPLTGGIEGGESELPLMTNDQWQMTNWIPDLASLVRNDGFDDCDTVSEGGEPELPPMTNDK